jgi:hypothetical protein
VDQKQIIQFVSRVDLMDQMETNLSPTSLVGSIERLLISYEASLILRHDEGGEIVKECQVKTVNDGDPERC